MLSKHVAIYASSTQKIAQLSKKKLTDSNFYKHAHFLPENCLYSPYLLAKFQLKFDKKTPYEDENDECVLCEGVEVKVSCPMEKGACAVISHDENKYRKKS